ncbi:MAG: hypothetical protein MI748_15760, partial [Opitutales bacterium]|nr:hypothetical protein [Opitutales bacterium]
MDITILNIELYTAGKEWNYKNVSNPYSRIYYITDGFATIQHNQSIYELSPGNIYLIPCYSTINMFCPEQFTHYYVHFTSRLQKGMDILSFFQCYYKASVNDLSAGPA